MSDGLSDSLLDFQLDITGGNRRNITQVAYDPLLPPSAPRRLENWQCSNRPIGSGGQGAIYLQRCTTSGSRLNDCRALKIIKCQDDEKRSRYIRELEVMARFSHEKHSKFFVKMLGFYFSTSKRDLCLAMEYYPQGDLHSYVDKNDRLSELHAQDVVSQILQGLAVMHEAGFAHRDVKPQNILIKQCPTSDCPDLWWVKLADFGISRKVDATASTARPGTYSYMAPELFDYRIQPLEVNYKATDIWSVGVLTFYLLTKSEGLYWRRQLNLSDTSMSLPNDSTVSLTGMQFILQTTSDIPEERLKWDHTWLSRFWPSSQLTAEDEEESLPPSPSSSTWSDIEQDTELVDTLATRLTAADLSDRHRREPTLTEVPSDTVKYRPSSVDGSMREVSLDTAECRLDSVDGAAQEASVQALHQSPIAEGIDDTDGKNIEALLDAIHCGDLNLVTDLLNTTISVASLNQRSQKGLPVLVAVDYGRLEILKLLVTRGADLFVTGRYRHTALHVAARRGHLDIVDYLVTQGGVDPRAQIDDGADALHLAVTFNRPNVVKYLVSHGADIEARDKHGCTASYRAAQVGSVDILKYLVGQGANIHAKSLVGWTLLHTAAKNGHLDVARYLLSQGANLHARDADAWSSLEIASAYGHLDVVQYLVSQGADVNEEQSGETTVCIAARHGFLDVVETLVSLGANIEFGNNLAFCRAASKGHLDVVQYLWSAGVQATAGASAVKTARKMAEKKGQFRTMEFLDYIALASSVNNELHGPRVDGGRMPDPLPIGRTLRNFARPDSISLGYGYGLTQQDIFSISELKVNIDSPKLSPLLALRWRQLAVAAIGAFDHTVAVFQVSSLSGQEKAESHACNFNVLGRFRDSGSERTFYHFSFEGMLPSPDRQPTLQHYAWEALEEGRLSWRLQLRPFFSSSAGRQSDDDATSERADDMIIADFICCGCPDESDVFKLDIRRSLSDRGYLSVVMTAFMIWVDYIEKQKE